MGNLVETAGTGVTVHGTARDNQFRFDAAGGRRVAINGIVYEFAADEAGSFSCDGLGGSDGARVIGTTGVDLLDGKATEVILSGTNAKGAFANYAKHFDEIPASAGDGQD
ncbi:MAG: hypothetical protein HUU20_03700 [Pirellulales bacterium]|nr:hypothetical protein [Pirellulales bacterium]